MWNTDLSASEEQEQDQTDTVVSRCRRHGAEEFNPVECRAVHVISRPILGILCILVGSSTCFLTMCGLFQVAIYSCDSRRSLLREKSTASHVVS